MSAHRQTTIDALKVLASQVIVLHHLASYGPVAQMAHLAAPRLIEWLYDYGRMAVQVFLVVGGYLAAQHLGPAMAGKAAVLGRTLWRRYLRLAPPFLAALLLTTAAAAVARHWLSDEFVPTAPTLLQFLAHATLLHEAVDAEALSAGVWYVAIDFQLHALLALLLWLGWRSGRLWPGQLLVVLMAMGSLWGWNRLPELDSWPIYFFGSYGLGAAAYWATANGDEPMRRAGWMAGMVTAGLLALLLAFRARIALSLSVAMLLAAGPSVRWPPGLNRLLHGLSRSSYALFLIHFPVLLLGNALFAALGLASAGTGVAMYAALWAVSVALGWVFERWVEAPLGRWVKPKA